MSPLYLHANDHLAIDIYKTLLLFHQKRSINRSRTHTVAEGHTEAFLKPWPHWPHPYFRNVTRWLWLCSGMWMCLIVSIIQCSCLWISITKTRWIIDNMYSQEYIRVHGFILKVESPPPPEIDLICIIRVMQTSRGRSFALQNIA